MVNIDDFNENVDYCLYVFDISKTLSLSLSSYDIQYIANKYVQQLSDEEIIVDECVIRDDDRLSEIIDCYLFGKKQSITPVDSKHIEKCERLLASNGGYGHYEGYDDVEQVSLRLSSRKY